MPAGYAEYPGPEDAEEGTTYTYRLPSGESVAATVESITTTEDGSRGVSLSYAESGGDSQ